MSETTVSRTLVVLSSMVWRSELQSELQRIGVPAEQAQRSAGHLLGRICAHAGWPRSVFMYDESEQDAGGVEE